MGNSTAKSGDVCYVCEAPATTRDNVPPGGVFLDPKPSNLIRVPACENHNCSRSKDDEYFRLVVATICADDPRAMQLFDGPVTRGLSRRPGLLRRWWAGAVERIFVKSPGGIIVDVKPGFKIDTDRVQRVVDNMVRGIYHHEFGEPLPVGCPVAGYRTHFPDTPAHRQLVSMMGRTYTTDSCGDFSYRLGRDPENPTVTLILMTFYRQLVIFTGTGAQNPYVTTTEPSYG
jgi:hypothetical protein